MTARAVVCGMVAGLVASVGIILLSPAVQGPAAPLGFSNPALVTVPLSLLVSVAVALWAPARDQAAARTTFDALRTRALTGVTEGDPLPTPTAATRSGSLS
jgi:Na+/proline symporter